MRVPIEVSVASACGAQFSQVRRQAPDALQVGGRHVHIRAAGNESCITFGRVPKIRPGVPKRVHLAKSYATQFGKSIPGQSADVAKPAGDKNISSIDGDLKHVAVGVGIPGGVHRAIPVDAR